MRPRLEKVIVVGISVLMIGCGREPEPATKYKPRERPRFTRPTAATRPAEIVSGAPSGLAPPHTLDADPATGTSLPAGLSSTASGPPADVMLSFTAPERWVEKEPRFMTTAVYALPAVEGDPEDADLAVSFLGRFVPLQRNVDRWCGQFEFRDGRSCSDVVQQRTLEGTKYPTTIVDISGSYRGGSITGAAGPARPGYRMLAAEIRTPARPWYVKLLGPARTVAHWEESFLRFVGQAE